MAAKTFIPINQGIAHQWFEYRLPLGSNKSIFFPKKINGSARKMLKNIDTIIDLNISGLTVWLLADFSAANGKIVKTRVADRNPAISENLVAI